MSAILQVWIEWLGEPERGEWCSFCLAPSAVKLTGLMTLGDEMTLRQLIGCPECNQIRWLKP